MFVSICKVSLDTPGFVKGKRLGKWSKMPDTQACGGRSSCSNLGSAFSSPPRSQTVAFGHHKSHFIALSALLQHATKLSEQKLEMFKNKNTSSQRKVLEAVQRIGGSTWGNARDTRRHLTIPNCLLLNLNTDVRLSMISSGRQQCSVSSG